METLCMQKLSVGDNKILAEMRKECIGIEHRGIFDCYTWNVVRVDAKFSSRFVILNNFFPAYRNSFPGN